MTQVNNTPLIIGTAIAVGAVVSEKNDKNHCKQFVADFKGSESLDTQKEYVRCIEKLHPEPMNQSEIFVLKLFIILAIIGFFVGGIKMYRDSPWQEWSDFIMGGLIGGILAPMLIGGLISGVIFLFS